jgi:hypothetical protein
VGGLPQVVGVEVVLPQVVGVEVVVPQMVGVEVVGVEVAPQVVGVEAVPQVGAVAAEDMPLLDHLKSTLSKKRTVNRSMHISLTYRGGNSIPLHVCNPLFKISWKESCVHSNCRGSRCTSNSSTCITSFSREGPGQNLISESWVQFLT